MSALDVATPRLVLTGAALAERNRLIWERERGACALCGRPIRSEYSIHHRLLRSRGGGDEVSNGVLLDGSGTTGCHGRVHAHPEAATALGFMIATGRTPADVAIRHALYGAVRFDDDGETWASSLTTWNRLDAAARIHARTLTSRSSRALVPVLRTEGDPF